MSTRKQYNDDETRYGDDEPLLAQKKRYNELISLAKAKFANATYSEVESSGPAAAPLGFAAPNVIRSKLATGLCLSKSTGEWSNEHILLHNVHNDEYDNVHIGYLLTPFKLRQTLCGEIIKGIKVRKVDSNELECQILSDDEQNPLVIENIDNLWLTTDDFVAIKVDRRRSMQRLHSKCSTVTNPENPWKEIAALQLLGNTHRNVIHLLGAFVDDDCLYEVMPYYSGGSLGEFMQSHPNGISETQARHIFLQIIRALYYIHSRGVCHHDISAENCMLDDGSKCVIIDFGMSLRVPHSYLDDPSGTTDDVTDESMGTMRRLIHNHCHCGKLRYMAPEIYEKSYAFDGLAADIWSAGVILFLMITGKHPYGRPDVKDSGYYDLIDDSFYWDCCKVSPLISWGCFVSSEVVDLLKSMLNPDPKERATLSQVLNHRWLSQLCKTET